MMNTLDKITNNLESFSKSERKVAEVILASPQTAIHSSIAALAKMNNTLKARGVIAEARDLLGGNGILLEHHVIRHMTDIEAIYTYEGTEHIQTLIVGRDITGVGAFS